MLNADCLIPPTRYPALPSKLSLGAVETVPRLVTGFQVNVINLGTDIFGGLLNALLLEDFLVFINHETISLAPTARA